MATQITQPFDPDEEARKYALTTNPTTQPTPGATPTLGAPAPANPTTPRPAPVPTNPTTQPMPGYVAPEPGPTAGGSDADRARLKVLTDAGVPGSAGVSWKADGSSGAGWYAGSDPSGGYIGTDLSGFESRDYDTAMSGKNARGNPEAFGLSSATGNSGSPQGSASPQPTGTPWGTSYASSMDALNRDFASKMQAGLQDSDVTAARRGVFGGSPDLLNRAQVVSGINNDYYTAAAGLQRTAEQQALAERGQTFTESEAAKSDALRLQQFQQDQYVQNRQLELQAQGQSADEAYRNATLEWQKQSDTQHLAQQQSQFDTTTDLQKQQMRAALLTSLRQMNISQADIDAIMRSMGL